MKVYKTDEVVWFPVDCKGCDNLISYDMSIDDWTNICKVNNMQIDDCDIDFLWSRCPKGYLKSELDSMRSNINKSETWEHDKISQ